MAKASKKLHKNPSVEGSSPAKAGSDASFLETYRAFIRVMSDIHDELTNCIEAEPSKCQKLGKDDDAAGADPEKQRKAAARASKSWQSRDSKKSRKAQGKEKSKGTKERLRWIAAECE